MDSSQDVTPIPLRYRYSDLDLAPGYYTLRVDTAKIDTDLGPTTKTRLETRFEEGDDEKILIGFSRRKQVRGIVYDDRNGNGKRDKGEPGIHAVRVNLKDTEHHAWSAEDGVFIIENVPVEMVEDVEIGDEQLYMEKKKRMDLKVGNEG